MKQLWASTSGSVGSKPRNMGNTTLARENFRKIDFFRHPSNNFGAGFGQGLGDNTGILASMRTHIAAAVSRGACLLFGRL